LSAVLTTFFTQVLSPCSPVTMLDCIGPPKYLLACHCVFFRCRCPWCHCLGRLWVKILHYCPSWEAY
jgi:hypothetical protein